MTHAFLVKVLYGIATGWAGAAAADFHSYRAWKPTNDAEVKQAVKSFQWLTAAVRWSQGMLSGGAVAAGLGALLG